jgi:hypothetical protein
MFLKGAKNLWGQHFFGWSGMWHILKLGQAIFENPKLYFMIFYTFVFKTHDSWPWATTLANSCATHPMLTTSGPLLHLSITNMPHTHGHTSHQWPCILPAQQFSLVFFALVGLMAVFSGILHSCRVNNCFLLYSSLC